MVREIKGFVLLQGYRGQEAVNLALLEKLIVDISQFVKTIPKSKNWTLIRSMAIKMAF